MQRLDHWPAAGAILCNGVEDGIPVVFADNRLTWCKQVIHCDIVPVLPTSGGAMYDGNWSIRPWAVKVDSGYESVSGSADGGIFESLPIGGVVMAHCFDFVVSVM